MSPKPKPKRTAFKWKLKAIKADGKLLSLDEADNLPSVIAFILAYRVERNCIVHIQPALSKEQRELVFKELP